MSNVKISQLAAASSLDGEEAMEVSKLSATVTITATTISAQASDNSYNDSANGFITAGFANGDQVKVVGFTGNVANNIYTGTITALTAGKMTIGGTDGDVIVDDAAGESVTITKWETKRTTTQDVADLAGAGGGSAISLAKTAWVETTGDDGTGVVGNPAFPFETIDAALDALTNGGIIRLGFGRFAPVTCDVTVGSGSLNMSSKMKSNLIFIGSGKPEPDSWTAPTTLNEDTGTVIDGPLITHSTRHNIEYWNLGIDAGSAVTTARYSGTACDGLGTANIGQVGSLAQARCVKAHNVIALCRAATSAVHALIWENVDKFEWSNLTALFGTHGFAYKGINGTGRGLKSLGHSGSCAIFKESNTNNDSAPCHDNVKAEMLLGNLNGADTPTGMILETADVRPMERLAISGINFKGIGTYDIVCKTTSSSGSPGKVRQVRLDGVQTDAGSLRLSIDAAATEKTSVFINGSALGSGSLDSYTGNLWAIGGIRRLLSSWAGALIRVRRSNDNAEQDIGQSFDGSLDIGSLLSFVGANSAYVTKLYDQSGNTRDFVQATSGRQPRIVDSGVYDGFVRMDGTDDFLTCATGPTTAGMTLAAHYAQRSNAVSPNAMSIITQLIGQASPHVNAGLQEQYNDHKYHMYMFDSASTYREKSYAVNAGTSEHCDVAVWDLAASGDARIRLYTDGAERTSNTTSGSGFAGSAFTNDPIYVGSNYDGVSSVVQPTPMNLKACAVWAAQKNGDAAAISAIL